MSMTPSETYYSNVMVDKIGNIIDEGDTRSWETIEIDLWHEQYDVLKSQLTTANKRIEILERALKYPESLPSDIYDLRDYFGEWCELSRQALEKSAELKGEN